MEKLNVKKVVVLLVHALIGWAYCAALIGIGRAITSMENTLVIHAIGAPIGIAVIAFVYFTKFHYTSPLLTAITFVAVPIVLDVFVVAMLIEKSFAMFASPLGTWIPLSLIFLATYSVGWYLQRRKPTK
jgi:hypothetical protein